MRKKIKVKRVPAKKAKRAPAKKVKARRPRGKNRRGPSGTRAEQVKLQTAFLMAFVEQGTIGAAAKVVNIARQTHYDWLNADPTYKERFFAAEEAATDILEDEARRRAVDGDEEPVGFYMGESSEYVIKRSDTLLKFLLEGRRKKIFGRRTELTGPDGGPITIQRIERVIVDPTE